ncbi:MAG: glycosyl hydrolase [Cyclobacteriaceae bacterium]
MKYTLILYMLTLGLAIQAQSSAHFGAPKFAPEDGQALLIVGQDLGAVGGLATHDDGYIDHVDHIPAGVTTYTSLNTLAGLRTLANWGSGDVNAQAYLEDASFDNSCMAIGLYLVNQLDNIIAGNFDGRIDILGNWIKDSGRPVFLRIGYEFDGSWNDYNAAKYKEAWIYIVNRFDDLEVRNVAYVWQSAGINTPNIERWYPGDEYINWMAYSHFDGPNPGQSIRTFAVERSKPIMIAEATPRGRDLKTGDGRSHWNDWFDPMFQSVYDENSIKALAYINVNWDAQPQWNGQGWGDSRVQVNETVLFNWSEEVSEDKWIVASDTLFQSMQLQLWQDSIMMDEEVVVSAPRFQKQKELTVFADRNGLIQIRSASGKITAVAVYDLSGTQLYESYDQTTHHSISLNHAKGMVIVRTAMDQVTFQDKIIVR